MSAVMVAVMAIGFVVAWGVRLGRGAAAGWVEAQGAEGSPGARAARGRRSATELPTQARESGSLGLYLVADVEDLVLTQAHVRHLGDGLCVVGWPRPALIFDRWPGERHELCTAPDGSVWRAVPGAGPDAPWVLERAPGWTPRDDLAREAGLVVQTGRA